MKIKEFWKMLARTKGWKIDSQGCIRKSTTCRDLSPDGVCPVCAVANKKVHKSRWDEDADEAADYLSLDQRFVAKVVAAADNPEADLEENYTDDILQIRRKLLKTLNLKEYETENEEEDEEEYVYPY